MGSHGIRDRVAIIGMGCTAFGEHWDKSADDMLVESATAATAAAGISLDDIDAFWVGTMGSGTSGLTLSKPLRLPYKPVTRIENMCATGSETLRNACYAVASSAYDVAMAIGVEKLKDSGFSGLAGSSPPGAGDDGKGDTTAPGKPLYVKALSMVAGPADVLSGSFDFGGGPGECVSFVSVVGTELGTQRSA